VDRLQYAAGQIGENPIQEQHPMLSYSEALAYLDQFVNYEKVRAIHAGPPPLGLAGVETLLARLGDPHRQYPIIHVAGTNGKGSVCAMIESMARAAKLRTGLYISPHLHTFRERICINGVPIARDEVATLVNELIPHIEAVPNLTWFEIVTAMGLLHFAQQKVQLAVVEVGAGGQLDATNVVRPWVSVVTTLSLDHTAWLGKTLTQIAAQKAGIIKPGMPVVSAPQQPEALAVIERVCAERQSPLALVGRDVKFERVSASLDEQAFTLRNADSNQPAVLYKIPLLGSHQIINAATAVTALNIAATHGLFVSDEAMHVGLANVRWPGRLEILNRDPLVVVDGAHNADSAKKLAATLPDIFGVQAWTLIVGISADKDIAAILDALVPIATHVIVTRARNSRAADIEMVAQQVIAHGAKPAIALSVAEAIDVALQDRSPIIIAGSLFTVADAREAWARRSGFELQETDE
jgi:dihydrofolate synthase / folylpolyglutamate synthase